MVRSSVLGGKVLTRLDNVGNKASTVFGVDGLLTVVQNASSYGSSLRWTHIDPLGLSEAGDTKSVYDPMGNYIQWQNAPTGPPPNAYPPIAASFGGLGPSFGYAINSACILDAIPTDCRLALNMVNHGSAEQCPNNYCGPERVRNPWTGQIELKPLTRDPDTGQLGYYPTEPQHTSRKLSKSEISSLMDSILKLFKNHHDCERSMDKLLGELKASTGYDAGSIRDVIEAFRQNGIAYPGDRVPLGPGDSGGGDAGTGMGGVPAISFSPGGTSEITAVLVMGEMMHWAGMPKQGGVYQNKFTDEAIANAASKLGFVMSIEQYRHTYPEQVAKDIARWNGRDMAESRVAHDAMDIKCLDIVTGMLPQSAKP